LSVLLFLHEHVGLSMILYLYKYDLILPCRVTNVVKFGVTLIFSFYLPAILGKYNFVIAPFVVQSHSVCLFFTFISLNSLFTVLFGILLQHSLISLLVAASNTEVVFRG
jgi:hypothetical protein